MNTKVFSAISCVGIRTAGFVGEAVDGTLYGAGDNAT